jgi:cell division protein ZapA
LNPPNGNVNSIRVEIFDQAYNLRGTDPDYIFKLAEFVDTKMRAVATQTSTVDSLRLAVLAALNIADEYHILKRKYDGISKDMNQRTSSLESALDEVLQDSRRAG